MTLDPRRAPAGLEDLRVRVTAVADDGTCIVRDTLGRERSIRYSTRLKGTGQPAEGETWVIRRLSGETWVLSVMLDTPRRPVVEGVRAGADDVALSVLDALVKLGLVEDGTT